ncbi:MAG: TlpA family protein disulfide reductase [Myxococcota bacterium]
MTEIATWICAAVLLLLPGTVLAQGVEQNPTGVQDLEPDASSSSETSGPDPSLQTILRRQFVDRPAPRLEWVSVASPDVKKRLEGYDRPVVVEFWATWCTPCKPMRNYLGGLSEEVGADVAFVALSAEDVDRIRSAGARENAVGSAYIPLGKVQESALSDWMIKAYPTVFVIRADGTVAGAFTGLETRHQIGRLLRSLVDADESSPGELLPAE